MQVSSLCAELLTPGMNFEPVNIDTLRILVLSNIIKEAIKKIKVRNFFSSDKDLMNMKNMLKSAIFLATHLFVFIY